MLTDQQRLDLRGELGRLVIELQERNLHYGPDVLVPELTAALVSLAAFFAHEGNAFEREAFEELCREMTRHEWEDPHGETLQ